MGHHQRVLCITKSLDGISQPVRTAKRVRYQCIETSSTYLCLGASTGSIYIYDRNTTKLIKFISNKLNGIVLMKFSSNNKHLAVADSTGSATVWDVDDHSHTFKVVKEVEDFVGSMITTMCWSDSSSRVFIGNNEGRVASFSLGFGGFGIAGDEFLPKHGESIVQLDYCTGKLLVSTKHKAVIYNEDRTNYDQIGSKSRDGAYGSCFLKDPTNPTPIIYSARPGSRLWEVDFVGNVLATHQFKERLSSPPSSILTGSSTVLPESDQSWSKPQSFNFPFLYPMVSQYVLTWSPHGIYVFEPRTGKVAAWNDQIRDVIGISTTEYDMYFLHSDCSVTEVSLLTTKECLFMFRKMEEWERLIAFACVRQEEILADVESFLAIGFHDLLGKFKEIPTHDEVLAEQMEEFVTKLENKHAEVRAKVEAKLNEMWTLSENHPGLDASSSNLDDTDDIASNISGGSNGSGSIRSFSVMSDISLNSFWQKATNIVTSKVISTGFIKKSLQDALEAEGVYLDTAKNFPDRKHLALEQKDYHSAPASPKLTHRKSNSTRSLIIEEPSKSLSFTNLSGLGKGKRSLPNMAASGSAIEGVPQFPASSPIAKSHSFSNLQDLENGASELNDDVLGQSVSMDSYGNRSSPSDDSNDGPITSVSTGSNDTPSMASVSTDSNDILPASTVPNDDIKLQSDSVVSVDNKPTPSLSTEISDTHPVSLSSVDSNNTQHTAAQVPVNKVTRKKKKVKLIDIAPAVPKSKSKPLSDVSSAETLTSDAPSTTLLSPPLSPPSREASPQPSQSVIVNMLPPPSKTLAASPTYVQGIDSSSSCEAMGDGLVFRVKDADTEKPVDPVSPSPFSIILPTNVSSLVNKLVNVTAATRNGIRDPGVLYNSKAIKDLLLRWANHSSKLEKEFRKECFKNLPQSIQDNVTPSFLSGFEVECRKLFFAQLASAFGEVSNVAMLCFETLIYPKQCRTIRHHEVSLLNLETSLSEIHNNTLEEWKVLSEMNTNEENIVLQNTLSKTAMLEEEECGIDECPEVDTAQVSISDETSSSNVDMLTTSTQFAMAGQLIEGAVTESDDSKSIDHGMSDGLESRSSSRLEDGRESRSDSRLEDGRESRSDSCLDDGRISRSDSRLDQISVVSTTLSKSDLTDLDMILDGSETDIGQLAENQLLCENFGIGENEECNSCFLDKCRACFVLRYFPVLDFTRMRSLLLWNGGCRWRTWLACMIHLQDLYRNTPVSEFVESSCIPSTFTGSEHDIKNLLGSLPRLYDSSPDIVLQYVLYDGLLDPWEVTLLYHTEYLPNSCVNDFLHYGLTQFSSSRLDSLFAINTLHSALMFQPNKNELFCSCGKARPGSHTVEWKRQNLLMKLVDNMDGLRMPADVEMVSKFSQLFAKNGFWLGYLHMMLLIKDVNGVLALVYQLGDFSLLDDFMTRRRAITPTDELWEAQFEKIYEDMEDNADHTCEPLFSFQPSLPLKKLLEVAAMHSGSKFALAMINKFRNHNAFPLEVYLSLVKAAELENKQDAVVSKLIEVASGKIWSDQRTTLHPQFQIIKNADITGNEISPFSPDAFNPSSYVMEECDTVWGRSINISTKECPVCTLPLCLKTMAASLIVFQCGHSFHKVCLPETACLVCFHDNFKSLY